MVFARRPELTPEEVGGLLNLTLFSAAIEGSPSAVRAVLAMSEEDDVDGDEEFEENDEMAQADNMDLTQEELEEDARTLCERCATYGDCRACECGCHGPACLARVRREKAEAEPRAVLQKDRKAVLSANETAAAARMARAAAMGGPPMSTDPVQDDEIEPVPGATCRSCGGQTVLRPKGRKIEGPFPFGCSTCGNLREEDVEQASLVQRLLAAKPKEVRRAGVELVEVLVDSLEKHPWYVSAQVRLDEACSLEEADVWAKWFERRGMLEGLAIRLAALKGPRFATVLEDCLDLAAALIHEESVILPTSVVFSRGEGWTRKELGRRIRELLERAKVKPLVEGEEMTAILDPTETYRLMLTRVWDRSKPPLVLFGVNPSTADATKDDQTIRRGRTLAKREGRGSLVMLNLYSYRSTDPKKLIEVVNPVGPENDDTIRGVLKAGGPKLVVCAWGNLANEVQKARAKEVVEMIRDAGIEPMCFGRTKDGAPKHPSRLPNDVALEDYRGEELGVRWFKCASCQDVGCAVCL